MDPRLTTAIIVVVGVPAVLVGYIWLTEQVLRLVRTGGCSRASGRGCGSRPRWCSWPCSSSTRRSAPSSGASRTRPGPRSSASTTSPGSSPTRLADRAPEQPPVAGRADPVHGRVRDADRPARRPGPLRDGRQVRDLRAAGHQHGRRRASSGRSCTTTARRPTRRSGRSTPSSTLFGIAPVAWVQISDYALNTILLIVVMAWMWTGFCMVILSAALKGINPELLEAARVDGATERQVFRRITLPAAGCRRSRSWRPR